MNMPVGLILEGLVAALLVATIGYCYVLTRKLERLRASQGDLRQVIVELVGATQKAESAISGLKATADETDARLSEKLTKARALIEELSVLAVARQRVAGKIQGSESGHPAMRRRAG